MRWSFDTIKGQWAVPGEAGGGGAWYAPSVAGDEVFWGIANPLPWGGTSKHPNGGAYAGPALYTDSLLALDGKTGSLDWYDQVTPHDVRDHDFQLPPILGPAGSTPAVFGAGKGGVVIAWDLATHQRIWQTEVGLHRNDKGPLPRGRSSVCPGPARGRADAHGRRGREAVRPRRRSLHARERDRLRAPGSGGCRRSGDG